MPDLDFSVAGVEVSRYAVAPMLLFKLHVANERADEEIASVMLQCQVQIESARRRYAPVEQDGLQELFGVPQRWNETLRTMLWTHVNVNVPPFSERCEIDLPVPCSYDFNVAAAKYFHALEDGDVPLTFQFSGSVFYRGPDAALQVGRIAWHKEAAFRLPVALWRDMMARYYPNGAWLCLHEDVFDRLYRYKMRQGLASWEQAIESLLDKIEEKIS